MTIQYEAYHATPWTVKTPEQVFRYDSLDDATEAHPDADYDLPAMAALLDAILG